MGGVEPFGNGAGSLNNDEMSMHGHNGTLQRRRPPSVRWTVPTPHPAISRCRTSLSVNISAVVQLLQLHSVFAAIHRAQQKMEMRGAQLRLLVVEPEPRWGCMGTESTVWGSNAVAVLRLRCDERHRITTSAHRN